MKTCLSVCRVVYMYCRSFALVVSNLRTVNNVIFNYHYGDFNERRQIASIRSDFVSFSSPFSKRM